MTAAWKQKKFERLAQKDLVEKLKGELQQLQDRLAEQKENRKYLEDRVKLVYDQRDQAMILAERYNWLRTQELMIATPDGFKLVTGEELDIHCGGRPNETPRVKSWPAQHMIYTTSADDALDSWNYAKQIQQSMLYGTSIVEMVKENGNTRSTSQEEDTKDT